MFVSLWYCSIRCLYRYGIGTEEWSLLASDRSYSSYSVIKVAPNTQQILLGNIHGEIKVIDKGEICNLLSLYLSISVLDK